MNRREALRLVATGSATAAVSASLRAVEDLACSKMGLVTYSLGIHRRNKWDGRHEDLCPALALLEEARQLGAGGIQVELPARDAAQFPELKKRAEQYEMHVEAIISPPKNEVDLDRFERSVGQAKEAGATLARTVIIPGRRYERFKTSDEFREFERRGLRSLQLAEPILKRHQFRLAVENHKDQRTWERLAVLERISSEYIGMCVDVGNSFALMEDPLEAVRAFAPWAMTVHLKDQAVRSCDDGCWLADVALGDGFLRLGEMVKVLLAAKPGIHFNFETITRDPIKVPFRTEAFWSTMGDTPAYELARVLRLVDDQPHRSPFPRVSQLPVEEQLALERRNVERSLAYARGHLSL
jgi:sugar phosphate isomerase/epimerase